MTVAVRRTREHVAVVPATNTQTSATTATNTGLTFNVGANETWVVDVQISAECAGTGGMAYAVAAPAGATIEGWLYSSLATILSPSYQRISAVNTLTATAVHTGGSGVPFCPDIIRFVLVNGSTAGAITVQIASKVSGQISTVFAMSSLVARRS